MADDPPPTLTSDNKRTIFETYVLDYLEKMNLHRTAAMFKLETHVAFFPQILRKHDGPKGHLYEWWAIFYDKCMAKDPQFQIPRQKKQVQVPDLNQPVQVPSEQSGGGSTIKDLDLETDETNSKVQIPDLNKPVQASSEQSGGGSTSTDIDLETDETKSSVPTMAGDPPTLASDNYRDIFETYLHNYLEKMNLGRTAATLVLETDVKFCSEILREYDGPKGHLYEWWLIFYETYSARHQQVQTPRQNQQIQAPSGQIAGGSTISNIDPQKDTIQAPRVQGAGSSKISDIDPEMDWTNNSKAASKQQLK